MKGLGVRGGGEGGGLILSILVFHRVDVSLAITARLTLYSRSSPACLCNGRIVF